jgi:hypothetical protein
MVHLLQFKRTTGDLINIYRSIFGGYEQNRWQLSEGNTGHGGVLRRILQVVPMNADKERNKEKQGNVFRLNQQKDQ